MADIFNLADTWNDGATTFNAIKMNVTDTASAAGSSLMDLQVGGVSKFRIDKGSAVYFSENLIEQYNSTNAQVLNIYNTRADASNYERGFLRTGVDGANDPVLSIGMEGAGTGSNGLVEFKQKVRFPYNVNAGDVAIGFNSNPGVFATDWGFGSSQVGIVDFTTGNTPKVRFTPVGINMYQGRQLSFGATLGLSDVGLTRDTAGVAKITDGSTGAGKLIFIVPTTDPAIVGALWNNAGTLAISAG